MQINLDLSVGDEVFCVSPGGTYIDRYIIRSISVSVNRNNEMKVSCRAQYYNDILRRTVGRGFDFSPKEIDDYVYTTLESAKKEAKKRMEKYPNDL